MGVLTGDAHAMPMMTRRQVLAGAAAVLATTATRSPGWALTPADGGRPACAPLAGNVRELVGRVERAARMSAGRAIEAARSADL